MAPSRPQVRIQTDPTEISNKTHSIVEIESRGRSNGDQLEGGRAANEIDRDTDVFESPAHAAEKQPTKQKKDLKLPQTLRWIPANSTWSKWKPVIRSALAGWIAVVVFIIPRTENLLGQVCGVVNLCVVGSMIVWFKGSFSYHHR